ncbi:methyltransf_25 domain-containing protein [Caerostris extrusa]|uniref:Methyltransf_25 domain-containing protein n=1 Tax=Caerostris extrusa TaxID=172846 RepID=A0AAV4XDH1_CAEEX|nr:methyltransf_25 domain-containing protein [Caerostris extrusa]
MIADEYNVRYILLLKLKSYPQWKDLSGEVVMDVGCGDGSESTKCILQLFPRVKKIIAIDKLRRVIAAAKRENAHPKIEYHVANITKKLTLMTWYNKISKIISFHCFEFVKLKAAFQNVFFLLKPGGEGVIVLMTSNAFRDAYDEMLGNPMWSRHLKNRKGPSAGFANYVTHFQCAALAQEVGLNVQFCQARENTACFENDEIMFPRHCLVSVFQQVCFRDTVWCLCFRDTVWCLCPRHCLVSVFPRHCLVSVFRDTVWCLCFRDTVWCLCFRDTVWCLCFRDTVWCLCFETLFGACVSETLFGACRDTVLSVLSRHCLVSVLSRHCLVSVLPRHCLVSVFRDTVWCLCFRDTVCVCPRHCLVSVLPRHCLVSVLPTLFGVCASETLFGVCASETLFGVCASETLFGIRGDTGFGLSFIVCELFGVFIPM